MHVARERSELRDGRFDGLHAEAQAALSHAEALQNVHKRTSTSHVVVSSRIESDAWVLEIRDDGRGFDVNTVTARGRRNFGLQFMRDRAELIGARFEVRSRPNCGTNVWMAIPLREEDR